MKLEKYQWDKMINKLQYANATRWLLDYAYFKENYRLIAVDLSKKKFRCWVNSI